MADSLAGPPAPDAAPVPIGTRVSLDSRARFLGRDYVAGGAPWRLLRLPGASRGVLERWRAGDVVRAGEERLARTLVGQGLVHLRATPVHSADDVDVVVPVLDDAESLDALLAALEGLRVTVVDDGSRDSPLARIAAARGARLVRLDENRGAGAARNAGVAATERPLVWFLDVDLALEEPRGVLHRLLGAMADPAVGATAPRVRGPHGGGVRAGFEHRFGPLDLGPADALVVPGGPVAYVPSACLLVRRDALGGGFDEALRIGEDVDLVWRLHDRGWLVRYLGDVTVAHHARTSWAAWWRQRVAYGSSAGDLARRHGERLAPVRADVGTLVAWAGVLGRAPLVGARLHQALRAEFARRLDDDDPANADVARVLATRSLLGAGGPLARALTRTYAPVLVAAALHPRWRRRALVVLAAGLGWRLHGRRARVGDVALALADDLAYSVGVAQGAWTARTWRPLTPVVRGPSLGWRSLAGLGRPPSGGP